MNIAKRSNKSHIINLLIANGARGLDDQRKLNKNKDKDKKTSDAEPSNNESSTSGTINGGNNKKCVPNVGTQEKKQAKKYVLTILKDGSWEPLTNEEMEKFEEQYPDVA